MITVNQWMNQNLVINQLISTKGLESEHVGYSETALWMGRVMIKQWNFGVPYFQTHIRTRILQARNRGIWPTLANDLASKCGWIRQFHQPTCLMKSKKCVQICSKSSLGLIDWLIDWTPCNRFGKLLCTDVHSGSLKWAWGKPPKDNRC